MKPVPALLRRSPVPTGALAALRRFGRDEDGGLVLFTIFMAVILFIAGGMAVDLMRYESNRSRLQNTADTAALAAASLTQLREPAEVVQDYFEAAGLGALYQEPEVTEGINVRNVRVAASGELTTYFLKLVGLDSLSVAGASAAEERIPNVEISLVLDISGSMRFLDSSGVPQITILRTAARRFIERMLAGDRDELVSISIVPYAGGVNPGAYVFNAVGGKAEHAFSHCIEMNQSDFDHSGLPDAGDYDQIPHFMHWTIDWGYMQWGWCPSAAASIQYLGNDAEALSTFVETVPQHDGTGTHYGMKWGLALLDPDSQPLIADLASEEVGLVPAIFADRPAAWDDPETLKVIVLMTDGAITDQFRPRYPDNSKTVGGQPINHVKELLKQSSKNDCNNRGCYVTAASRNTNRERFYDICDLAKDNGVVVYTIAFNTTSSSAATEMRTCASSPAHYFNVQSHALDNAFQAIAGSIQMLRLTE